ncbi:MAG: hypothetical protein LDL51_07825 [Chloroflexi bacterium]|nr:hypothetical protein [Chloroflexota bacterium]
MKTESGFKKVLLNSYQKNSLQITLRMFEENLRNALEWLDGREEDGVLYSRTLILSEDGREQARRYIQDALGVIEKLSRQFDLRKESNDAASMLRGELEVSWANLLDTRSKKLGRYGKVHPELLSALDSDIQKLAEIAQRLSAVIGKS